MKVVTKIEICQTRLGHVSSFNHHQTPMNKVATDMSWKPFFSQGVANFKANRHEAALQCFAEVLHLQSPSRLTSNTNPRLSITAARISTSSTTHAPLYTRNLETSKTRSKTRRRQLTLPQNGGRAMQEQRVSSSKSKNPTHL